MHEVRVGSHVETIEGFKGVVTKIDLTPGAEPLFYVKLDSGGTWEYIEDELERIARDRG